MSFPLFPIDQLPQTEWVNLSSGTPYGVDGVEVDLGSSNKYYFVGFRLNEEVMANDFLNGIFIMNRGTPSSKTIPVKDVMITLGGTTKLTGGQNELKEGTYFAFRVNSFTAKTIAVQGLGSTTALDILITPAVTI